MVPAYIIILCLSAALVAGAAVRVQHRVAGLFHQSHPLPAGLFAAIAAVAFLVVIAAPAALLVGAILLLLLGLRTHGTQLPPLAQFGGPLLAVLLGLSSLPLVAVAQFSPLAVAAAAGLAWLGLVLAAPYGPEALRPSSLALGLSLVPLLAAPLLFPSAPGFIAFDAAILLAALAGASAACRAGERFGAAQAPFALLLGWLQLEAALHGAWMAALASLLAWGAAIAYATGQQQETHPDAFTR